MRAFRYLAIAALAIAAAIAALALVVLPLLLGSANSPPLEHTPADRGLAYQDVELHPSDQAITIRGWWIPADEPRAAVLFVHGGNGNREDFYFGALDYYRALHERNLDVLTIDLRNHGASDRSATGHLTFGKEEKFDAKAALEWLRAQRPGLEVFGSGDSMGGATLLHLATEGARFDGLILVDPVLANENAIAGAIAATLGLPRVLVAPTAWSALHLMTRETLPANPMDAASGLSLPILLVQDETDPVTQAQFARAFASANHSVELHLIPVSDDDAVKLGNSGWGTHVSAFRRQPKRVLAYIDAFLASH